MKKYVVEIIMNENKSYKEEFRNREQAFTYYLDRFKIQKETNFCKKVLIFKIENDVKDYL